MIELDPGFKVAELNGHFVIEMVVPCASTVPPDMEVEGDLDGAVAISQHVCINEREVFRLWRKWRREWSGAREPIIEDIEREMKKPRK